MVAAAIVYVKDLSLAFIVGSVEGFERAVLGAGGRLDPAESAWEFRGHRVLDCLDPEGNVVQARQPVAT
jgi:hypothetical protein